MMSNYRTSPHNTAQCRNAMPQCTAQYHNAMPQCTAQYCTAPYSTALRRPIPQARLPRSQ